MQKDAMPTAEGCRWCGADPAGHGAGNDPGFGPHEYLVPTPDQVELRAEYQAMLRQFARGAEPVKGRIPEPNGCLWCGKTRRGHGIESHHEIGYHRYTEPPTALIEARMIARRQRPAQQ